METHLYEWTTGPGVDSALISSSIPERQFISVETANPRLILLQEGEFAFTLEVAGQKFMVTARPGDTLIIPDHAKYWYRPLDPNNETRLVAFRIRFFTTSVRLPAISEGIYPQFRDIFGAFKHLPQSITPRVQFLIDQYREEAEASRIGRSEMLQCISTGIFIEMIRQTQPFHSELRTTSAKNRAIVRGVHHYLAGNLKKAFSLDDVGWHLNLSGEHVARVFKKETQTTIFACLKELRVRRASELLAQTDQKVHEIAAATGFSSHALFSREFRKFVGISPEEFRKQRQESISLQRV